MALNRPKSGSPPGEPTVPLAELLLTKLQIIELNEKDVRDTVLLFHGHVIADHDDDAVNGKERMLFFDTAHDRQVDVFVGAFRMCHEIPLNERLAAQERTVPLAELLLTKLQIIELNEKDVRDTLLLAHGHEVAESDGDAINAKRIAELCAADWGLWRTITQNVAKVLEHAGDYDLPEADRQRIAARLQAVLDRIEAEPKTRGWKLRAKIGERKRWYDLPEEVE